MTGLCRVDRFFITRSSRLISRIRRISGQNTVQKSCRPDEQSSDYCRQSQARNRNSRRRYQKTFKPNQPGRNAICRLMHCNALPHALLKSRGNCASICQAASFSRSSVSDRSSFTLSYTRRLTKPLEKFRQKAVSATKWAFDSQPQQEMSLAATHLLASV